MIPLLFAADVAWVIGLIVAACELPTPLANSLVSGHRVALTPDHLRGRVQAAGTLVTMSLAWLGPLVVGIAFALVGAALVLVPPLRRAFPEYAPAAVEPDRAAVERA